MCTLRNFRVRQDQPLDVTVAEALIIALSTPPLFTSTSILKDSATFEYMGGDLALSNPIQEIIADACRAFDLERRVACILSLGCGHPGIVSAPNHSDVPNWIQFLEQLVAH